MSRRLAFPAIIPVRNATEEQLAATARASVPLQAGRRLAAWFGDGPVDAGSGWRSAHAQQDAAVTLGLVARGDAITDETTSRLRWIYEVAYHAGYLHASEDHELIHWAGTPCDAAERTDAEIIADWCARSMPCSRTAWRTRCPREPIRHRWTSPAPATTRSSSFSSSTAPQPRRFSRQKSARGPPKG